MFAGLKSVMGKRETVADVMDFFHKGINRLQQVEQHNADLAAEKEAEIAEVKAEADRKVADAMAERILASREAEAAREAADRLRAIVGG